MVAMTVKKFLGEFELYIGAVLSGTMFLVLFAQVVSRYVFNNAFSWSEELALILFVWSIYFGATAAIRRNQHLRLEILLVKFKPRTRLIMEVISNAIFALFNCFMIVGIIPIVQRLFRNNTSTAVMGIPKWINYAMLPLLFTLMIYRLVQDSVAKVQKFRMRVAPGDEAKTEQ